MIRLVFLFFVTFCLGFVTACDQEAKLKCIQDQKKAIEVISKTLSITTEDKLTRTCGSISHVRTCIKKANCSEDDVNEAMDDLSKELNLNCDEQTENVEENCLRLSEECEQLLVKKDKGSVVCKDVEVYRECFEGTASHGQACKQQTISRRIIAIMKEEKLECPGIWEHLCMNLAQAAFCVENFMRICIELDLEDEPKCRLAVSLERCVESKGQCVPRMTQEYLRRALGLTDCSEYVDACSPTMEVDCAFKYGNSGKEKCEKLKDLKECLRSNSSCPMSRIHFTLRRAMQDEAFDCPDVNACSEIKAEDCQVDVFANLTDTKENQCRRFKQFKTCMVAAKCNEKYLNSKAVEVGKLLNNPCDAASSLLASIGLTLLVAIFTSLWN